MKFSIEVKVKGISHNWIFHVQNIVRDVISSSVAHSEVEYDGDSIVGTGVIDCVNSIAAARSVDTIKKEVERALETNEDFVTFNMSEIEVSNSYSRVFEDHE